MHRDVLKIIKLFAQNLRRHFFVRKKERYYTLRLAHVFGCYKLALAVRDNARLHHEWMRFARADKDVALQYHYR